MVVLTSPEINMFENRFKMTPSSFQRHSFILLDSGWAQELHPEDPGSVDSEESRVQADLLHQVRKLRLHQSPRLPPGVAHWRRSATCCIFVPNSGRRVWSWIISFQYSPSSSLFKKDASPLVVSPRDLFFKTTLTLSPTSSRSGKDNFDTVRVLQSSSKIRTHASSTRRSPEVSHPGPTS